MFASGKKRDRQREQQAGPRGGEPERRADGCDPERPALRIEGQARRDPAGGDPRQRAGKQA